MAINSNGAYLKQSLKKDDIKLLLKDIKDKFQPINDGQSSIKDTNEVFYIPLAIAFILLFISLFSLPKAIKGKRR